MPIPDEPRPELVRVLLRPLRTEERVQIEVKAGTTVRALRLVIEQKFGVSPATKILKFTKQRTYVVCPAGERINRHRIFHLKDVEWLTDPSAPLREIVSRIPSAFTTEMPYEAAKQEVDAEHPRQRFRVVVTHMWVRAEPTLEARRLGTLALNDIISGHEANGWLRLDAASSTTADVEPGLVAWALIDGRPFGYALLLERLDADRSGNEMGTLLHGNGAVPTLKERALRHDGAVHRADSLDSSTGADGSLPSEVDELGLPQVEAEDSGLEQQRVAQSENDQLQDDQEASNLAALGPEIWAVMQDLRGIDAARTKALELLELLQEATGASRRQESSTDLVYEGESPQCTDQSMEMSPEHWPSESRLGSEACEERCVWTPQVTTPQFKDPLLLRQVFPGGVRYGEWYNASEKTRLRAPLTMLRGSLAPDLQAYLLDRAPFNAASYGAHVALRQRYGLARDRQKVTDPADFVKADWHTIAGWPEGVSKIFVPRRGCKGTALRAPDHVVAFAEAFRMANEEAWEACRARLRELAGRGREELAGLAGVFSEALRLGRHFGAVEVQHFTGSKHHGRTHIDGNTSLLHLAVSLGGRRTLHADLAPNSLSKLSSAEAFEMSSGDVYLSSPSNFAHSVSYPECGFGDAMVAIHMRILFDPVWWMQKWVNHQRDVDMRHIAAAVTDTLVLQRLRLPTLHEVRQCESEFRRRSRSQG